MAPTRDFQAPAPLPAGGAPSARPRTADDGSAQLHPFQRRGGAAPHERRSTSASATPGAPRHRPRPVPGRGGEATEPVESGPGRAYVAQAAEHFLGKEEVPGSNPGVGSIASRGPIRTQDGDSGLLRRQRSRVGTSPEPAESNGVRRALAPGGGRGWVRCGWRKRVVAMPIGLRGGLRSLPARPPGKPRLWPYAQPLRLPAPALLRVAARRAPGSAGVRATRRCDRPQVSGTACGAQVGADRLLLTFLRLAAGEGTR